MKAVKKVHINRSKLAGSLELITDKTDFLICLAATNIDKNKYREDLLSIYYFIKSGNSSIVIKSDKTIEIMHSIFKVSWNAIDSHLVKKSRFLHSL